MKAVLACCGGLGLLVLAGPITQTPRLAPDDIALAPAWLNLPAHGEVQSIAFTGSLGDETARGTVEFAVDGDAEREISAMKARLAANGFEVQDQLTSVDAFMGASSLAVASSPVSGRTLQLVRLDTPAGAILRVSFVDTPPLVASSE